MLTAEEFVNDYLVDRKLVGPTRATKVASLLDAWIRQSYTGPHSRQVEHLRQRNADLRAQRDALLAALKRLYWLVTELASDDAFDNGVYAPDGRCEGNVIAAEIIEQARAAIAGVRGEEEVKP